MNLKAKRENEFKGQKRSKGSSFGAIPFLRKKMRELGFLNGEICELLHENQRLK